MQMQTAKRRDEVAATYAVANEGEAYREGFERGYAATTWIDTPSVGDKLPLDVDWQGIGTIETVQDIADAIQLMAGECESNDRQFSPFEHTASFYNSMDDADEVWQAFDDGISDGIIAEISERDLS